MGITASLFYSADTEKQTLDRRIRPSEAQIEAQQERWNALAEHLLKDLAARSGYSTRSWLQGSYKFGTQVRPAKKGDEFDIDLGIYFEWEGTPEDGNHGPEALKEMVQKSLLAYEDEAVLKVVKPPKSRCSRIRFKDDFHIDVPCYHLDPTRDARTLATTNGWEESDPKAIYLWFRDRFDDEKRAKARRLVRYVKCWAALTFAESERPSSILLTVLVAEAMDEVSDRDLACDDDALLAVLKKIVDRLERDWTVKNPVNEEERLSDRLTREQKDAVLAELRKFRSIAEEALACDGVLDAADKWAKVFAHFFPLPEDIEKELAESRALVPVLPDVRVIAVPNNNQGRRFEGMNRIGPIPKDCTIYFEIVSPGCIQPGDMVEWMVRNEGDEAEYRNDLGHYAGCGVRVSRHSAYKGTHYMDCIIHRNGRLVAVRRISVEILGSFMPPRNPVKRPDYVGFRSRR